MTQDTAKGITTVLLLIKRLSVKPRIHLPHVAIAMMLPLN